MLLDFVWVLTLCITFNIYLSIRVVYSLMVPTRFIYGVTVRINDPPTDGGLLIHELMLIWVRICIQRLGMVGLVRQCNMGSNSLQVQQLGDEVVCLHMSHCLNM